MTGEQYLKEVIASLVIQTAVLHDRITALELEVAKNPIPPRQEERET